MGLKDIKSRGNKT